MTDAQMLDRPVPSPSRRRLLTVVALVVVTLGVSGLVLWAPWHSEPLPGVVRDPLLDATGMEFVDYADTDDGEAAGLVPPADGVTLAYFGYLSCPDVCPTTMADIRVALRKLDPALTGRVTVAFLTVDPDRDTGPEIRDYLAQFFAGGNTGMSALRADGTTTLDAAADRLGVTYQVADHTPGADRYDVAHSAITYVVDDTGTVVRELPFGTSSEDIARVLRAALDA